MLSFRLHPLATEEFITATPFENLSILPSGPALEELQAKLEALYKIYKLREALDALEGYDEIWIDTPPAPTSYTRSALIAADACLIPFDCDEFARRALYSLIDNVNEIRADHNPGLEVEGIVINQFQARATLPQQIINELRDEGLPVLASFLSSSVRIKESHQQAKPMIHLDRGHKLALEFASRFWSGSDLARLDDNSSVHCFALSENEHIGNTKFFCLAKL
jgi:chromosome partitioning protein